MMVKRSMQFGLLVSTALLVACGGGGGGNGSSDEPQAVATPEGVYEGTVSNGKEHNTLVLDNGQYFTLYGTKTGGAFDIDGFIQGSGTSTNGSFTSTDLRDFFEDGSIASGTLSASFTPNVSFNGTVTEGNNTVTFTGKPLTETNYNYQTAASLANIVGPWNMVSVQGDEIALSITASGAFSGETGGCTFNGTIVPRASGKNVFDMALTFGRAPCLLPGESARGIALEHLLPNGQRQLLIAGTNTARTSGAAIFGVR